MAKGATHTDATSALESMTPKELAAHIRKAQAIHSDKTKQAKLDLIAKYRGEAEDLGLSYNDLFPDDNGPGRPSPSRSRSGPGRP
jgi:hypothetical protein